MDDSQIRSALKRTVLAPHFSDPQSRVIDELGLEHGTSRIDVAVVNGRLHGFEIKSHSDTLARLPVQMPVYNSVLDQVTLVAETRHLPEVLRLIPDWWGIKLAEAGPRGGVRFHTIRRTGSNPNVQAISVARLLWREEAIMLLEHLGEARGLSKLNRAQVHERAAAVAPLSCLRSHVRACLKARRAYRFR